MSSSKTVLIVEDELPLLGVLKMKLTHAGMTVLEAQNGEDGLQMAINRHPDLIFLDLIIPKMNGMTMLEKLRQDTWGKDAKVIILTNVSADIDGNLKKVLEYQPTYYFTKSDHRLEDVVEKAKEILGLEPPLSPTS